MYNRAILVGRLTADPQLRYTNDGKPVCNFTLAVDRPGTNEADFFDIVTFGNLADISSKYLYKGRLVLVEGRLQTRTYETQEGVKRKVWEIVARDMRMLDKRRQEETSSRPARENRFKTKRAQEIREMDEFDDFSDLPF